MYHNAQEPVALDMNVTAEAERAYWLSREPSFITAAVEINVTAFHEAAGMMQPRNWRCDQKQDSETFMMDMICEDVTEIFARIGSSYFRLCDYSNLNHAAIVAKVMAEPGLFTPGQK